MSLVRTSEQALRPARRRVPGSPVALEGPEVDQPLTKRSEECFRGEQISSLEPFRAPPVDGGQYLARLGRPALSLVEACKAGRAS